MSKADQQTILALYILHGEEEYNFWTSSNGVFNNLAAALEIVNIYKNDDFDGQERLDSRLMFLHYLLLLRSLLNEDISLEHLHEFYDLHELEGTDNCINNIFNLQLEIPEVYKDR